MYDKRNESRTGWLAMGNEYDMRMFRYDKWHELQTIWFSSRYKWDWKEVSVRNVGCAIWFNEDYKKVDFNRSMWHVMQNKNIVRKMLRFENKCALFVIHSQVMKKQA